MSNVATVPSTRNKWKHCRKCFKLLCRSVLHPVGTSTATMGQQGNHLTALSAKKDNMNSWIVDLGASDHMTRKVAVFADYTPCHTGATVRIANGLFSTVDGIGLVILSKDIRLHFVLFVPKLEYNLLSISKLTKDLNCITKFSPNMCELQVLGSRRTIGNAEMCAGLYLLRVGIPERQPQKVSCVVSNSNKNSVVMLWHYRLGHPNFMYLKRMFHFYSIKIQ